jgi:general secretion pathway protein E
VILGGADATSLHNAARHNGMNTLYEDGLRKVARGTSSLEEVLRVTLDQQEEAPEQALEPAKLLA